LDADTALTFRIAAFALLSIGLMVADHRFHHLETARNVLSTAIYPFQYAIQTPMRFGDWLAENLVDRRALLAENEQLRHKQLLLGAELQRLSALEAENRRLRQLLEYAVEHHERVLVAELIQVALDPYRHQILINRGSHHGVRVGRPLLNQAGIIGQVIHANTLTAQAILITDPSHVLPVQVNRTGLRTLAAGTGHFRELQLSHILTKDDVAVGDLLVTSGLDGRFPAGYPVAKVVRIEFDPIQAFTRVIAEPVAQLDRLREVLLLNGAPPPAETPP
jgi:rod shape-determining protein MreC